MAWILHSHGAPALEILGAKPSISLLVAFGVMVAATILSLTWRWRFILAGLGPTPPLLQLALFRSAAHSLAVLVPSGKLAGDPLRAWLTARADVGAGDAIASVAVDRALEIGTAAPFSVLFAVLLVQRGIPELGQVLVTIIVGTLGLFVGVGIAVRRLRRGAGLVTALARRTRLDGLRIVEAQMDVIAASEGSASRLVAETPRILGAFAAGLGSNLLVIAEFTLLLAAFGLPVNPTTVVAAIFATGAAHMFPVPAGIGVLEGGQVWLFGMLGYPADVGLAVGLAVRLRELLWMLPGVLYLAGRYIGSPLPRLRPE